MLKYMCLIVLVSQIYGAPVDDTDVVNSQAEDSGQKKLTTQPPKVVEILESGSDHQIDGSYSFHYRGADGTYREETAVVINPGTEEQHLEINGAYSFFDTDGKEVVVHYKADDKGFVPVGSNIPDIISVAARENSQLPVVRKDDDEDVDDASVNIPNNKEYN